MTSIEYLNIFYLESSRVINEAKQSNKMFTSSKVLQDNLEATGSRRRNEATKDGSKYYRETLQSYIPAELAERMNIDRQERMRTKVLMAAGLDVDETTGKASAPAGGNIVGAQKLLVKKIDFHREVEQRILKFIEGYAQLYYEYGLMERKEAVRRAAAIGNYLLDEVSSGLEGDDTDKVLEKAPNMSGNLSGLSKLEKTSSMQTGKE